MDDYILIIALGVAFCSLAMVTFVFLHCRKVERQDVQSRSEERRVGKEC